MAEQEVEPGGSPSGRFLLTQAPPGELRNVIIATIALTGLPALVLVFFDGLQNPATAGAIGVILVSLAMSLWLVRYGLRSLSRLSVIVVLSVGAVALIGAYVLSQNPITVVATSAPFGFGVAWIRPRWLPAVVGGVAVVAAVPVSFLVHGVVEGRDVVQVGVFFAAALVGFAGTSISWQMQRRLDQQHADQNELSLARERLRFATDLHDIQGHTLLAIKMKAELARRSLDRDPERVAQELQDIEDLAAEAGDQTRQLAQGYRALTLAAELANFDQLLSAAGIHVRINHRGTPTDKDEKLFATLVRESASNVLRHADAEQVRIELTPTSVSIRNDGAAVDHSTATVDHGGSGLTGLEQRFQSSGGVLSWRRDGESFTIVGSIGEQS